MIMRDGITKKERLTFKRSASDIIQEALSAVLTITSAMSVIILLILFILGGLHV